MMEMRLPGCPLSSVVVTLHPTRESINLGIVLLVFHHPI
jgi:hypothetical protein